MNRNGQTMIVGVMILAMTIILFIALIPALSDIFDTARQCNSLNCEGYIDPTASGASCTASNRSYDSSLEEDTLSCTMLDLGIPYLILAVLVALVTKLIHGRLVEAPQPEYGAYPGY